MRVIFYSVMVLFFLFQAPAARSQGESEKKGGMSVELKTYPAYRLLERLLELPEGVTVHQFSSHNKRGQNGDENWPLYRDENGDDVIFDAAGPGCIRSMWGTNFDPESVLNFYFDGEESPRYTINYIDFYRGKHPHFPSPLISYEKRGYWGERPFAGNSFVPVPFEKSLKIVVKGKSRFFHIIYERYPYSTPVTSFTGGEDRASLRDSFDRFGKVPLETEGLETVKTETKDIEPGQPVTLFKAEDASGIIRRITMETDGSSEFLRETQIRIRYEGHQRWDVLAPTGMFFGSGVEANDMNSLPLSVEVLEGGRVRLSSSFPIPFWKQAEIVLTNLSTRRFSPLQAEIYVSDNDIDPARGTYFTTLYRDGVTTYGRDWLLFESPGTGWYAGTVQTMHTSHYCEGDEHFYIDGAVSPQLNGTGSEDYYLACFWPNVDFDTPFGCVVGDAKKKGGGEQLGAYYVPGCYSRYHLEAPVPFYASMDARIQHGGLSHILSNYRSLAFTYMRKGQSLTQTDYLDVGNSVSETDHGYRTARSGPVTKLEAYPEGEYFEFPQEGKGRYHSGGEISFTAAVDPANRGIRLRRRLDQSVPRQKASVYIDGEYAGSWYHGYENKHLRWFDSDIDIHPDFTRGKSSVEVKLVVEGDADGTKYTDFEYKIYCFR